MCMYVNVCRPMFFYFSAATAQIKTQKLKKKEAVKNDIRYRT